MFGEDWKRTQSPRPVTWDVHAAAEVFVDVVAADDAAARDALAWDGVPAAASGAQVHTNLNEKCFYVQAHPRLVR